MNGIGVMVAIVMPVVACVGGVGLMRLISGSRYCDQLRRQLPAADRVPLYRRLGGYDAAAVDRYWLPVARDDHASLCEVRFQKMDLLFPFFYCAAGAFSVLILGALAERSVMGLVGLTLVALAITFVSDLTENLIQLNQLQRYLVGGGSELNERWIAIASLSTKIKLYCFMAASLVVALLALAVLLGL